MATRRGGMPARPPTVCRATLNDREILVEILHAQVEIAKILFLQNINNESRVAASDLLARLSKIVARAS